MLLLLRIITTTTWHIIKTSTQHLSAGLLGLVLGNASANTPNLLHSVLLLLDLLSRSLSTLDKASLKYTNKNE
jgi:hypothetical protein